MITVKDELTQIVGAGNVSDDSNILSTYGEDNSFVKSIEPRFVVKVQNANQVQKLVKWANKSKTPLIPISSKGQHFKGDTVPSVPEAVIVDLSGMKKILSINRTHRMAVIEPGVTYEELKTALEKAGMELNLPLAPRDGKSVVTSLLETEPRLNALHQWSCLEPLRCVEVIWGDGNRIYTGEAGGSEMDIDKQWEDEKWQIEAAGPMMLDFYRLLTGAQGTMGIVTWASVRCELKTEVHKGFLVPANQLEDLIDFSYKVLRLRFSEEFFIMNRSQLAALMADDIESFNKLNKTLPPWIAVIGIAGREILPEERVASQEMDIKEIAQSFGLNMTNSIATISGDGVLKHAKESSGESGYKSIRKGAYEDIFFSTTLDKTPGFIDKMKTLSDSEGYIEDIGVYLQPENMGTSYHCSFTLPFNKNCKAEVNKTKSLFLKLSTEFSNMGAYYARPYGIWSKLQLNKDAESYKILQELKGIYDPNGILNPGKLCNY